ncbi:MAG: TetR/AcrR family transcriptional regulator [Terriglobia bacterium]
MRPLPPHTTDNFHQKLDHILACATRVFGEKGYDGASIRDIARASGVSLAGLYYYFRSKEELLFLIQKHTFTTLIENLQRDLARLDDPNAKLGCLIRNHLRYFLSHPEAMKVLSHESESLSPPFARVVADLKRSYYRICRGLLGELSAQKQLRPLNTRVAVLSLFGMINWIHTWYNPRVDPDADELADTMATLFFSGVLKAQHARLAGALTAKRGRVKPARRLVASTV